MSAWFSSNVYYWRCEVRRIHKQLLYIAHIEFRLVAIIDRERGGKSLALTDLWLEQLKIYFAR